MQINDLKQPLEFSNERKKESSQSVDRSLFNNLLESNVIQKKEDETENLYKDLMSLLKTGYTEEELVEIEKILKELESLKKSKSSATGSTLTDIEKKINDLENTLKEAQLKATGRATKTTEESKLTDENPETMSSYDQLKLLESLGMSKNRAF